MYRVKIQNLEIVSRKKVDNQIFNDKFFEVDYLLFLLVLLTLLRYYAVATYPLLINIQISKCLLFFKIDLTYLNTILLNKFNK